MSVPPVAWTTAVTDRPPADVEAGTLLGAGANRAADHVGEGAVAVLRPGGRVEIRAGRDGVPSLCADGVTVGRLHELDGGADGTVRGSLRVGGHVAPGRALVATGPIRVEGNIDRSEVRAGGELQVEGRSQGADLVGGTLAELRARLHGPLGSAGPEIDALVALAGQLLVASAARGGAAVPARVIQALCADRFTGLESRLADAGAMLAAARRGWPGLCAGLAAEVAAAHRAVTDPGHAADPLGDLTAAAGFIAAAIPARRGVTAVGVRLPAADRSAIATAGPLRLLGAGATDCDIDVGGDLTALGPGGGVRGGTLRAGGRVRAGELARGTSGLRVEIDPAPAGGEVLAADVVGAGVEVAVNGHVLRFDRRRTGVRVAVEGGRPVLQAA